MMGTRAPGGFDLARVTQAAVWICGILVCVLVGRLVADPSAVRPLLVGSLAVVAVAAMALAPRATLVSVVGWLLVLGLVRRLADASFGATSLDPFLLVGPLAWTLLVANAATLGAFRLSTPLSKSVLAFSGLVVLAAANPLQGSGVAGVAGLLFVLVPIAGFWVGRAVDTASFSRVLRVYAYGSVAAALYGFLQTLHGFPSWDRRWIVSSGYGSLHVGEAIRPFGTFASAGEYAFVLACGIVVWMSPLMRTVRRPIRVAAVGVLLVALVFESSRTPVVMAAVAIGVMIACRSGRGALNAVLAIAIALTLVVVGASWAAHHVSADSTTSALVAHQLTGLANPTNTRDSTLIGHLKLVGAGVVTALKEPVGTGLASVTLAGSRLGGGSGSTEADPSNVAVAMGIPGLLAYIVLVTLGLRAAMRQARIRRPGPAVAAAGIIVVTLLQWLNGGQYAVAFLPWLALGYIDRLSTALPEEA